MKNTFLILFALLVSGWSFAQDSRQMLRGKVLYRSSNVPNENVINSTSGQATITDENGEFVIAVKDGDQLVFTAVNYQLEVITVTSEILQNNRLVVEVTEKVRELDEVVVTPDQQERFLQVKIYFFCLYSPWCIPLRISEIETQAFQSSSRQTLP